MINENQYYIVDVDDHKIMSKGYDTEEAADDAATKLYGDDYWTNETPYAIWQGSTIDVSWIK